MTRKTRPRRTQIAWLGAAAAALLVATAVPVSAAFSDHGYLNATFGADFGIGGIDAEGTVHLPGENDRLDATFTPDGALVPGDSATLQLRIFNNSTDSGAALGVGMTAAGDVGELMRYSATLTQDGQTTVLFGDPNDPASGLTADDIPDDLGAELAPRHDTPLDDGDAFQGPADSEATIEITAHLVDADTTTALSSASTIVTLTVIGSNT